jgi:uncharacterized membrane protein YkvA (DUF1232 family)
MRSAHAYSEQRFRHKFKHLVRRTSRELVENALCLYYVVKEGNAPTWAKATALGALGYLINPLDLIPDITPVAGYTDDLGMLTAAVATLALYITPEIRQKAAQSLQRVAEWAGGARSF